MKDLIVINGKVKVGDSASYHVADTLAAGLGHFKNAPIYGVAARRMIAGTEAEFLLQTARIQINAQKINIKNISYNNGKLEVVL